jgi:hypothetical protein
MNATRLFSIASMLSCGFLSTIQAGGNTLAPIVQLSLTPKPLGDFGAVTLLGELGARNFRGAGTYGVYFNPCSRLKLTGEFLTQDLSYHGLRHHSREWVSQYAVGGEFEQLLSSSVFQSIDAGGYYSHAFQKKISSRQRIAGSDGGYGYLGTTVKLWNCAFLSADVNYDHVHYNRKLQATSMAKGWGGSLAFVQQFSQGISLGLDAELRRPFNLFGGRLNWSRSFARWAVDCGVFGNYTDGKKGVPNVTTIGVQIGFSFGPKSTKCCRAIEKTSIDYCYSNLIGFPFAPKPTKPCKAIEKTSVDRCYSDLFCDLASWVKKPAVHLPVVLATLDQLSCSGPPTSTPIGDIEESTPSFTIETASHFLGKALTFDAKGLPVPPQATSSSINPLTGLISINNYTGTENEITVTATNKCGLSSSETFLLLLD